MSIVRRTKKEWRIRGCVGLSVGLEDVKRAPQITPQLRKIQAELRRMSSDRSRVPTSPIYYLAASDYPEARKVLDAYYSIPKTYRDSVPIEACCLAADVSPLRILEIIVGVAVRIGAQSSALIAAASHPSVVKKTVEMALTDDGHSDRVVLHRATGFLPAPKGAQTTIQVSANAQSVAASQSANITAPPPEQTIRRLVDRFNIARGLPSATETVPAVMPATAAEPEYAEIESVEEESSD